MLIRDPTTGPREIYPELTLLSAEIQYPFFRFISLTLAWIFSTTLINIFFPPPATGREPVQRAQSSPPVDLRGMDTSKPLVVDPLVAKGRMSAEEARQRRIREKKAQAHIAHAAMAMEEGRFDEARYHLKQAMETNPDDQKIRKAYDFVLLTKGDMVFQQKLEQERQVSNPKVDALLGALEVGKGDIDASIRHLMMVLEKNPGDQASREALGIIEDMYGSFEGTVAGWAVRQVAWYEKVLAELVQRERQAGAALEQARGALELAESLNDTEAILIAREAIGRAGRAAQRARHYQVTTQMRIVAAQEILESESISPMAVASKVRGRVYKKIEGGTLPFDGSAPVSEGDEIHTGPDGFIELVFTGGSTVQLGPNSIFFAEKLGKNGYFYDVIKGRIHAEYLCIKNSRKPCEKVVYHTKGINATVRGTDFFLSIPPEGPAFLIVMEGVVEVADNKGGKTVKVCKGELLEIREGGQINEPFPVDLGLLDRWWEVDSHENH